MIYLDNGATTIDKDPSVARAISSSLNTRQYANPARGLYDMSLNSLRKTIEIRKTIGDLFAVEDYLSIAFMPNITYGLNTIIQSLIGPEDHVITSEIEHNSVLRPLYSRNCDLSFLTIDELMDLDFNSLKNKIRKNTKALVVNHCSNVLGLVVDLDKIYDFCMENDLVLIVDGAQTAGMVEVDLSKYERIIYSFTGHKGLHGPMGTGGLVIKGDYDFKQVFSGGSGFDSFSKVQPKNLPEFFEPGTVNLNSFIGLEAAIKVVIEKDLAREEKTMREKCQYIYDQLASDENFEIYNHRDKLSSMVSFNILNMESGRVSDILWREYKIATRPGSHCAPLVHKRLNTVDRGIVRVSLSTYTSWDEIYSLVSALGQISQTLK